MANVILVVQEFFLSLLSSAATKREAKSYLSRFPSNSKPRLPREKKDGVHVAKETEKPGVNLGSLYGASRSVLDSPVFRQDTTPTPQLNEEPDESLHVALVKVRTPQLLDDETVRGVALTLSQMARLGMASCVVVDPGPIEDTATWRRVAGEEAGRLSAAIDACHGPSARRLDSALTGRDSPNIFLKLLSRQVLLKPLQQNHTVVIVPVAYTEETSKAVPVPANEVILSLTRELAGLGVTPDPDEDPAVTAERIAKLQKEVTLDRLILLDPLGGIPAFSGPQKSHVFINMEQEYEDIEEELLQRISSQTALTSFDAVGNNGASSVANSNPFSRFASSEVVSLPPRPQGKHEHRQWHTQGEHTPLEGHLDNLRLLRQTLAILPPSSSGIIITPADVANSARPQKESLPASPVETVGTRRQKNPLIHNLLTDKPSHSSSLPLSRLSAKSDATGRGSRPIVRTTFVKRGMPLTILPNPRVTPWTPDNGGNPRLTLDDPRIDLPRLVHLIEDSFNRKLDVQHYLNRVNGRIAGLIIAGEYEGGAILTWETPAGVVDDGSPASLERMVPYLDKFAVLKRSQGAGGVADVVFNAMVRSCLPQGVCWRSRMNNPVNKWYFERSRGTWKLSGSNWAMFWTTPGVPEDAQRFRDYEAVCRSIEPSWADNKAVAD
jgi:amino-acid N-acetyltransferase